MAVPSAEPVPAGPLLDVDRLRAELEAFWAEREPVQTPPHLGWGWGEPPIAGTVHDQQSTTVNPYWEIARLLPTTDQGAVMTMPLAPDLLHLLGMREKLTVAFGYVVPSPADVAWIVGQLDAAGLPRRIAEVCAGAGYWAWQLTQAGVEVDATDACPAGQMPPAAYGLVEQYTGTAGPCWAPVQAMDAAEAAAAAGDVPLMMVWPPYRDPAAYKALRAYTGDLLFYCGEYRGCTADDRFFNLLDRDWTEVSWSPGRLRYDGLRDHLVLYRRKPPPPPGRPIGPLTRAEQDAVDAGNCMLAPYGCTARRATRWWCATHKSRWRRTGDAGDPVMAQRLRRLTAYTEPTAETCALEFCDEPHHALGLCAGHYSRVMRDGHPGTTPIAKRAKLAPVDVPADAVAAALKLVDGNIERLRWNPRTQKIEVVPSRRRGTPRVKTGRPTGRPPAMDETAVEQARQMVEDGVSVSQTALRMGVSAATLRRYLQGWKPVSQR
ncbi:helix-turn-helix domain-containing protein [Actinomadura violacea]|uniref:Hin recombinase n=1 Tax=Actinomadura violacea TaxID=2819934 RepID=A0ABS3RZU5_9ACTN|nr:helix-turn-helix domain-containing protein [Actinomadura violacea]MBO2461574.1 Hin recombinase [Actinomadura violacea]